MKDPTTHEERTSTAQRCARSLQLDVPMAVDGIDDAVALAYNAWPERIYIVRPDGRIHYKSGLGPFGFKPREADASLAKLLGLKPQVSDGDEPESGDGAAVEDDGFSGAWSGQGEGSTTGGRTVPFRLFVRRTKDGTVGGRVEAGRGRTRMLLADATFDAETRTLRARTSARGQPLTLEATQTGDVLKGQLLRPDGQALFTFEVTRRRKAPPLVPGPQDARGTWLGEVTGGDPAQVGKEFEVVLLHADPESLSGAVTIDGRTAEIERGRYDAATGALSAVAATEDGATWSLALQVEGTKASGRATLGTVGLVVAFAVELQEE